MTRNAPAIQGHGLLSIGGGMGPSSKVVESSDRESLSWGGSGLTILGEGVRWGDEIG